MSATEEYLRQKMEREQQQRIEASNQMQVDPGRAARIFAVSAATELPPELVDSDLDNLEQQVKAQQFDRTKYTDQVNGAPAFNRFVAENPYHLAVLESSHRDLSRLERTYRQMSLGWRSGWAMTEIAEIRDRQLTDFENPDNEADRAKLEELQNLVQGDMFGADAWYSKLLVGTAQQVPIQAWLLKESADEAATGAGIGAASGAALGSTAGGVGAIPGAVVGFKVGLGKGFLVGRTEAAFRLERGLAYDEFLGMGLNEEESRWAAAGVGGVNAALEAVGMGAIFKRIPGFDKVMNDRVGGVINSVLTKPTLKQAVARASLQYGETIATEVVTEIFQEATLIAAGEMLKTNERERGNTSPEMLPMGETPGFMGTVTSEAFWGRVGDIAVHTLYGVGLIGGVGPTSTFIRDSRRAYQANRTGAVLDAMGDAAEKAEVRKTAPTVWEKFVQSMTKDGETVLVDKEKFTEYFQTQGMDPEQVANSIGVPNLKDQMDDVGVSDIAIPADQYLAKVAPSPHHKGLKNDIRASADAMTIREAEAIEKAKPSEVKSIEKLAAKAKNPENDAIDEQIVNDVKQQLIKAATSPEAAENQKWIMAGIPNIARRMGMDPMQLYREFFGGVYAEGQQNPNKNIDIMVDPYIDMLREGTVPSQRKIFGPSLGDEVKRMGGLRGDPELEARDLPKQIRGLIKETGDTLDGAAEWAAEQGFIPERDIDMLLDALQREAEGELVFGNQFQINEDARTLRANLEELGMILDQHGIDYANMTNLEVRNAMEEIETYYQLDDDFMDSEVLDDITRLAVTSAAHDPKLLAQIAVRMPTLAPDQDYGDIKLKTPVENKGRKGIKTERAQTQHDRVVKRKGIVDKLKDCLRG